MIPVQDGNAPSPMMAFFQIACGHWISQALNVAAKLGVADLLKEGAKSIDELAEFTDTHPPSLYRLLRSLTSVGVFSEVEPRTFALTPIAEYLRSDRSDSLRYLPLTNCDEWQWRIFGELYHSVKDGQSGVKHVYQVEHFWEYLSQNRESEEFFSKAMTGVASHFHTPLFKSYDFSKVNMIVDVAGGQGTMISSILRTNPHLRGILFDTPQVVAQAIDVLEKQGVANRCETIGGNFFQSVPSGGDVYTLSYVLCDWDDESCITILRNISNAMVPNGKVLAIDSVIPIANEFHWWGKWVDLVEIVFGSGKIRTEAEYNHLFQSAGFKWVRTLSPDNPVSAMELVRA
ncbi:methyltransferase [Scytonema sp. NUACC21]